MGRLLPPTRTYANAPREQTITPAHLPPNPIRLPLLHPLPFPFWLREQQSHQHNDCVAPTYWQTNSSQAAEEAQRTRPSPGSLRSMPETNTRFGSLTKPNKGKTNNNNAANDSGNGGKNCKELAAKGSEITNEQIKCCRGFDAASKFSSGDK